MNAASLIEQLLKAGTTVVNHPVGSARNTAVAAECAYRDELASRLGLAPDLKLALEARVAAR